MSVHSQICAAIRPSHNSNRHIFHACPKALPSHQWIFTCLVFWKTSCKKAIRVRLHWSQNRENRTAWTVSGQGSKIWQLHCWWQWLQWTPSDWPVFPQQQQTVWDNKTSFFRAGSLAGPLLLFAYNSSEGAMEKTYLIELVRDMSLLGTKETERDTTDISSRNTVVK